MRWGELLKPPLPLCTHNKSRVFICTEKAKKKKKKEAPTRIRCGGGLRVTTG